MKTSMFRQCIIALLCCITLVSCVKDDPLGLNVDYCAPLQQMQIQPIAPVVKGETVELRVSDVEGANYQWTGPNNFQSYSQNNTLTTSADYSDQGWYYVRVTLEDCDSRTDSVYVDVRFPQGTASCTPVNNTATFNSALFLADQTYYFVSFGAGTGGYNITANSSDGDMNITMSPYWIDNDFEDGIYYTSSNPIPEYSDLDKVHISNVNQNIYWVAEPNKPVYISHVNGKRRIAFCTIDFSGDWGGTLYHTTVDAQITQP